MMLALGTITKKDVCEFRRVLEKSACLLLSEKGVPADERRQFEEILAAMESADEKTLPALDRDFHTMLSWSPSWMPSQRFIRNGSTS